MSVHADGKPGGANGEIQYNDAGAFAGVAGVTATTLGRALIRSTYATGTLTLAAQPTPGDTITLGVNSYTYVNGFPNSGEIDIGADLTAAQENTVFAVNQGIAATLPTAGAVSFIANVSAIVAGTPGTAGNGVVTTSVFTDPANFFGQLSLSGGTDGTSSGHVQAQTAAFTGSSPGSTLLRLQTPAGQDETEINIVELIDADSNPLFKIDGGGNFYVLRDLRMVDPTNAANFTIQSNGKVYFRIPDIDDAARWQVRGTMPGINDVQIFALRPRSNLTTQIQSAGAGSVALEINTNGVDTTDLIQAYGTVDFNLVFRLLEGGAIAIAQHSAPADADVHTGDMAIWFDQTPSASKLMIKAKDSDGTVVTGEVALS